ncbi:hypothetical protein [Bradyrhizobium sp. Rc2d]|uniref:hypothetical protein n=1 Tax=Bradyrhizobium sp. Rc2d TaxID=1855321 RepID=UPI00115F958B|nr:hypothetical protein [Bradyrhizobium sp. Rc2d]
MRQADDGKLTQQLSVRAVPRDRHRVHSRLEIRVAENFAAENFAVRRRRYGARFHRSLGFAFV